ncbi:DUF3558 domain-containing protein [Microbispora sp. SCL1-1]|uniref:DUF3558 domain-containing protein n=1 Tax=unclassified Microbispora TaxID=2614687 RepID=UPI0011590E42|nr:MULTISPECIES: DUF3558 domain-containing protein [unclassified Microbispora]NJP26793.1 DUF3558 domain-containing protein [Microbispora sp. CL1-1]TQS11988.1 DUF3558 domain-containing protein [Microbispora sp. SCL1-1]
MELLRKCTLIAILGSALALVVACGGGAESDGSSSVGLPGAEPPAGEGSGNSDSCKFLTKEEVAEAIGPHDGGQQDYTFGGCVWTASSAKDGINEAIFAAVLPKAQYESVAEIGQPVSGVVDGATYDETHGELWFPCRGGDYCGIKVRTASPDGRQETALRLSKILQGRV